IGGVHRSSFPCACLRPGAALSLFSARASIGRGLAPSIVAGLDLFCDVSGVVFHPPDQRGTSRLLPGQAEEKQPRHIRDSAPVKYATVWIEHGKLDPRVVRAVAGGPDQRVDLEFAPILEANRLSRGIHGPRLQLDSMPLPQLARARSDERIPMSQ